MRSVDFIGQVAHNGAEPVLSGNFDFDYLEQI